MRTVDELDVGYAQIDLPKLEPRVGVLQNLERRKLLIVVIAVVVGFGARVYRLDAAGFAEDEANKIFAIRCYEQGDLTANAEHPMVMKLLCYASMRGASAWNRAAGNDLHLSLSDEAALRLPNAAFGALTVIPLFLLTTGLLGFRVGLITSVLWALGLDAIWFSRTAKEDTLLVFFMFCGFYLYHRAKQVAASEFAERERLYALAGAAFGLMMASKYFPHYFGLNALFYTLVGYDRRNNQPLTGRMWAKYFGALLAAFVIFNPAAFFPQTWRYLWKYVNEELLTHHGYMVMDTLFVNDLTQTPGGAPWYFYFLFIGVKLPLPVLLAFGAGLVEIFGRRGDYPYSRGYLFLRMMLVFWLVPEALVGCKFLRYSLSLMPIIYITAAVGVVAMFRVASLAIRRLRVDAPLMRAAAAAAIAGLFIIVPSAQSIRSVAATYPSLFVNVFGGNRIGYFFPHDEFYDLGARESIQFITATAPAGAMIASEIPGVVQYYLERFNRPDIRSRIISQPSFTLNQEQPTFVILQRGRVYFENIENFKLIENSFPLIQASIYEGAAASKVFRIGDD
ncbi:MAG TPA: glycosyltransferase family 39 protein [Blastocatellia bacterium]|nr:glycosyltransferase family 39 protein [Blastocatellia bacterium]